MCGIIGIFNCKDAFSNVVNGLKIMHYRGKDASGVCNGKKCSYAKNPSEIKEITGENIIGHNLHSIVNYVEQPIQKKGCLSINCEIYNWKELAKKYNLNSKNDSEMLIDLIEKKGIGKIKEILSELDGVYSFCYLLDNKAYIARDIMGVKPLWYSQEILKDKSDNKSNNQSFGFASEKKALLACGFSVIEELNPRTIIEYDISKNEIVKIKRDFFSVGKLDESDEKIIQKTEELLISAVEKRFPDGKFGILFSGGIDSTFIATVAKKLGRDFTCYTAALSEDGMEEAADLVAAEKAAEQFGFKLKVKKLGLSEVKTALKTVVPLIEDNNVVKVGVALTFFAACELAKKDGMKVIFSGLGSEELFAGYERHKKSTDINKECLSGLLKIYERDMYRDDVITMYNNLELRLPFLDKKLVEYSLKIPERLKLDDKRNKIILREISKRQGITEFFYERKKKAAQYGSKFDKAIERLTKKEGFATKSLFLEQFYKTPNVKLGALWSSGKDSALAAWIMKKQNYEITCLISLKSKNPDSYMFHTPNIGMVEMQGKACDLPLIVCETAGEKEKELADLKRAILQAKQKFGIEGIVTGAIFSNYQRDRIEKICDELELKIFSPLWHIDQEKELRMLISEGFVFTLSSVAALGLDSKWLGHIITEKDVDKLVALNKKYHINVAGEGGEYESLVLDCPLFSKEIKIIESEIIVCDSNTAKMNVKKAELVDKNIE